MLSFLLQILAPALFAMAVVAIIHPSLVKIAVVKSIFDNPDSRKLNKKPMPVLGGVGIFIGIVLTVCVFSAYLSGIDNNFLIFSTALLMLYTGAVDDVLNLSAVRKLLMQIVAVSMLILLGDVRLDSLCGLWGIYILPDWISIPLTLFAGVGIINSINLIDGVDGLSSGYCIVASVIFGTAFWLAGNAAYTVFCFAIAGSIVPFFIHNCFGRKYKMYMGDGGSLALGLLFFAIIARFIQGGTPVQMKGVVSFLVAILSIPVYDTLRVMISRMIKRRSPFSPDKTHLHHLFVELGFSHRMTTFNLLILSVAVVAVWVVTELVDAVSIDAQFYIVVGAGLLFSAGLYFGVNRYSRNNPERITVLRNRLIRMQKKREHMLRRLQRILDTL